MELLPSPLDVDAIVGTNPKTDAEENVDHRMTIHLQL